MEHCPPGLETLEQWDEFLRTNYPPVGVGELIHEKVDSLSAKAVVAVRQHRLQLHVVDDTVTISIHPIVALNDLRISARWEGRWHDLTEGILPKHCHTLAG